jgi:hypothetical protein
MYRPRVARQPGAADPSTLPLLLYLPGIDGTGLVSAACVAVMRSSYRVPIALLC